MSSVVSISKNLDGSSAKIWVGGAVDTGRTKLDPIETPDLKCLLYMYSVSAPHHNWWTINPTGRSYDTYSGNNYPVIEHLQAEVKVDPNMNLFAITHERDKLASPTDNTYFLKMSYDGNTLSIDRSIHLGSSN